MYASLFLQSMDPSKRIFALLFLISNRLETIGSRFLGEITSKQWFLLAAITTCFSAPPSISEAAACVGLSHQNVKKVAVRLESKGFLKLEKDSSDHRIVRLIVTEKAYQYERENRTKNEAFLLNLFSTLTSSEQDILQSALLKLLKQLEYDKEK